eukprot:6101898-Amphidinium_carterae.2
MPCCCRAAATSDNACALVSAQSLALSLRAQYDRDLFLTKNKPHRSRSEGTRRRIGTLAVQRTRCSMLKDAHYRRVRRHPWRPSQIQKEGGVEVGPASMPVELQQLATKPSSKGRGAVAELAAVDPYKVCTTVTQNWKQTTRSGASVNA